MRQLDAHAAGRDSKRGPEACEWQHWDSVRLAHQAPVEVGYHFGQTITALGSLAIVPFPGEIFSEIALRLKLASPFPHTLCAGSANGSLGYLATREARGRGGYEVWVGRAYGPYLLADDIDDVLVRENLELLERLRRQEVDEAAN
jgi:hypothetical protein